MTMKDGSNPEDPRLGRLREWDPKSTHYKVGRGVQTFVPRSYTWNFDPAIRVYLDQGVEGACVWFSIGNELQCKPRVWPVTNEMCQANYYEAQKIDEWPGGAYPEADPQYDGTSVLAGAKVAKALGYWKEYRWAFSELELAWAVSHKGPAVLGLNWYEGMMRPDPWGQIHPTGQMIGGHAILARGFSLKTGMYRLPNTWGADWGKDGECFISRGDMARLLQEGGEACIPVRL